MEILSQMIRQTRYYGPDVIPFVMISRRSALSDLQATYHFESVSVVEGEDGPVQMTLRSGGFVIRQEPVVITQLMMEPRRIELRVAGCTAYADTIMRDLELWVRRMGGLHDEVPLTDFVLEEQSTLVAHLGFAAARLLNPALSGAVGSLEPDPAMKAAADTRTVLEQIRFAVELKAVDYSLAEHLMPVQPRFLSFSPRPTSDPAGQIYECQAPLSTDRHIAFLTELEKALCTG